MSWTKSEGHKVQKGESVVVVESDKADMDVLNQTRQTEILQMKIEKLL